MIARPKSGRRVSARRGTVSDSGATGAEAAHRSGWSEGCGRTA